MKQFNTKRFAAYMKMQWHSYKKLYLRGLLILFGALFLFYLFNISIEYFDYLKFDDIDDLIRLDFRHQAAPIFGLIYLVLQSGQYFLRYAHAQTGIGELTLPVSNIERINSALIFSLILPILTFLSCLIICDAFFVSICKAFVTSTTGTINVVITTYNNYTNMWEKEILEFQYVLELFPKSAIAILLTMAAFLCSLFTLGSLYFKRFAYLKTSIATIVAFAALLTISAFTEKIGSIGKVEVSDYSRKVAPEWISNMVIGSILAAFLVFIWAAAYFRLKEKEL